MAIELDIRVPKDSVPLPELVGAIARDWDVLGIIDAPISVKDRSTSKTGVADNSTVIEVSVDGRASIQCFFYLVPAHQGSCEESLWCCVALNVRNNESVVLMASTASSIARLAGSGVIDEASILKAGRRLDAEDITKLIAPKEHCTLEQVSIALASRTRLWSR